jgi:hypothetical protein
MARRVGSAVCSPAIAMMSSNRSPAACAAFMRPIRSDMPLTLPAS